MITPDSKIPLDRGPIIKVHLLNIFKKDGFNTNTVKDPEGTKIYCKEFRITFQIIGDTFIIKDINGPGYGQYIIDKIKTICGKLGLARIVANNFSPRSEKFWMRNKFSGTGRNLEFKF